MLMSEQPSTGVEHVERIEKALEEIDHLGYVKVEECPHGIADVRVQVAEDMKNALINNGEFAQFHGAGYVGHHINFEEQFVDLRSVDRDTDGRGDSQ